MSCCPPRTLAPSPPPPHAPLQLQMDALPSLSLSRSRSRAKSPALHPLDKRQYALGIGLLLLVVVLWTSANFVTQVRPSVRPCAPGPRAATSLRDLTFRIRTCSSADTKSPSCASSLRSRRDTSIGAGADSRAASRTSTRARSRSTSCRFSCGGYGAASAPDSTRSPSVGACEARVHSFVARLGGR